MEFGEASSFAGSRPFSRAVRGRVNQFVAHVAQTVMESTIGTEWINRGVTSPLVESGANKKLKKKKKRREKTKGKNTNGVENERRVVNVPLCLRMSWISIVSW